MVPSCWSCVGKRALAELSTRVINTQTDRHTDHVHVMRPKRRKTATKKFQKDSSRSSTVDYTHVYYWPAFT